MYHLVSVFEIWRQARHIVERLQKAHRSSSGRSKALRQSNDADPPRSISQMTKLRTNILRDRLEYDQVNIIHVEDFVYRVARNLLTHPFVQFQQAAYHILIGYFEQHDKIFNLVPQVLTELCERFQ